MKELVLVGRGGQGVVLASQILADTLARAGFCVQSFPEFKAERRGAPISAFLRWDDEPIHRRYKVRECDVLVVVSAAPPTPELLQSVRPGGLVVLNRENAFPGLRARSRSRASPARGSPARTASSPPRGGRWATWPCSARASGSCSRTGSRSSSRPFRRASGAHGRAEPRRRGRGLRALHAPARARGRRARTQPRPPGRGPPADALFPISFTDSPLEPHRLLVGRAAGAHGRVHGVRASARSSARRARSRRVDGHMVDRRALLQGLRDLRGRLPRARRDRDGGGDGVSAPLPERPDRAHGERGRGVSPSCSRARRRSPATRSRRRR